MLEQRIGCVCSSNASAARGRAERWSDPLDLHLWYGEDPTPRPARDSSGDDSGADDVRQDA